MIATELKDKIPRGPVFILTHLNAAGYETYLVGGCVRDLLMGVEPHDWDITTNATPEQVKEVFSNLQVLDTGLKHGTVTLLLSKEPFEITTFRVDGDYSDGRHPDSVRFAASLEEDLSRRDFSINAIAMDKAGNLKDPFRGAEDVRRKVIRCVGDPHARFQEDGLRILRALRFASRLGFHINADTERAIHIDRTRLSKVSAERIQKELMGILMGESVYRVLTQFPDVMSQFIPELAPCVNFQQNTPWHCYDVYGHIAASVDAALADPILRLTMLFHDIGKPQCCEVGKDGWRHFHGHAAVSAKIAEKRLRALRFDNETIEVVTQLVSVHDTLMEPNKKSVLRMVNKLGGYERFTQFLQVREADIRAQSRLDFNARMRKVGTLHMLAAEAKRAQDAFRLKDLAVNGNDLLELGFDPGPELGQILHRMLDAVIDGNLSNSKESLLAFAKAQK